MSNALFIKNKAKNSVSEIKTFNVQTPKSLELIEDKPEININGN